MTDATTADLLREVVEAWHAFDDDGALRWELRMAEAIQRAEEHLNPSLPVGGL